MNLDVKQGAAFDIMDLSLCFRTYPLCSGQVKRRVGHIVLFNVETPDRFATSNSLISGAGSVETGAGLNFPVSLTCDSLNLEIA